MTIAFEDCVVEVIGCDTALFCCWCLSGSSLLKGRIRRCNKYPSYLSLSRERVQVEGRYRNSTSLKTGDEDFSSILTYSDNYRTSTILCTAHSQFWLVLVVGVA
jgi:hypothetical protein